MSGFSNSVITDAQVYAAISTCFPELSMERSSENVFQFAAMPMEADWDTGQEQAALDWCELVSPRRDGYYMVGSARFSQAYRTLLLSADRSALGRLLPLYEQAKSSLERQGAVQRVGGCLSGDRVRWETQEIFDFTCEADSARGADNAFTQLFRQSAPGIGKNPLDILLPRCSFHMEVKGAAVYPVLRRNWYQQELVVPGFPLAEGGVVQNSYFFGPGGSLQHTPLRLLVSYDCRMILHLDREGLTRILGRNSMEDTVRVAGLEFSLSKYSLLPQANALGADQSFHVELPAAKQSPQIWGVLSRKAYL